LTLADAVKATAAEVDDALLAILPEPRGFHGRVQEAMRYAVMAGGKRLRPFLVLETASLFDVPRGRAMRVACAIECLHTYSLVHDDLPAMDDDDLRRGRPTCHKAFDEATAVLVGDSLLPLAFELLVRDPSLPASPAIRLSLVDLLAEASGSFGMAGGQAIDLAVQGQKPGIEQVEDMHARKTGALIRASVLMAARCLPGLEPRLNAALNEFAVAIGLAFQIQDDLLDVLGDVSTLGKATGADRERDKPTHPAIIGVEASQERVNLLHRQALTALTDFGERAAPLRALANWLLSRRY
jgi:geranylgeranyl pyrophosphate synthase